MSALSQKVDSIERYTVPNQCDKLISNVGLRQGKSIITLFTQLK